MSSKWKKTECVVCGSTDKLTRDHVIPRWFSHGVIYFGFRMRRSNMGIGPSKKSGLFRFQTMCEKCNSLKSGHIDYSNPLVRAYVRQFIDNVRDILDIHDKA